ncbi:BrnA antitoxin family protein [Bosea vestrisii]|uniref:BrnA antitoxin family protein n=1 Tax=Bosea vestrisii TaxID=151416 RepID=UPI0024DF7016|nr:BrnA antitoxin family protein [Bosea vestrisii]WID99307.1 BrnA antitoxin family protein [Bosea vestrisii]
MNNDRTTRRPTSARESAEALFKAPAPVTPAPVSKRAVVPGAKEVVTLRIDSEVLAHFQDGGPGWQDRINAVLRKALPAPADEGLGPDELNSSNDG